VRVFFFLSTVAFQLHYTFFFNSYGENGLYACVSVCNMEQDPCQIQWWMMVLRYVPLGFVLSLQYQFIHIVLFLALDLFTWLHMWEASEFDIFMAATLLIINVFAEFGTLVVLCYEITFYYFDIVWISPFFWLWNFFHREFQCILDRRLNKGRMAWNMCHYTWII